MRTRSFTPHLRQGLTLIELLVVVAIIGVLASILLASLNTAHAKGRDANRVASLQEMAKSVALNDVDPAPFFYTAIGGSTKCGAYTDVRNCLGIGATTGRLADNFSGYKDPSASASVCQGMAGTPATASCQFSISTLTGTANPTTQNYEICSYLETGTATLIAGRVMVTSSSGASVVQGCN
jgi:prepilin-type N-terminal cleavage/methylation domain-containing protein